ncbi:organic solvent tolerance protein [Brevundimonas sp. AAP58]|uniref:LPS-assembly protein LptD n=1 Tax=Brevundimonas sp. AAP58 TaxID=1523422 RepID=UPI0006B9C2FC|nr:LPS assembly protein LptD [Brevundimonas sp. AAP58]KPF73945.1 organic solvent tolerance protein [Brevundimonas sp. AAP58]
MTKALRLRLLAGAAAFACLPGLAQAQTATPRQPDIQPETGGLAPGALYIEADSAGRAGDVISATGDTERVFARYQDHTLIGQSITFDIAQGIGTADGEVELTDPEGNRVFASHLELDEDLRAGVAVDFATRLTNGASLMAATAVRRSENVNELNYALFTPCPICDADGNPEEPSLSIQAEKVVQDEELRAILYRNAVFKLGGVPVFWLPAFAHPDPTVERASGFLVPTVNYDDGRGLSVETPYLRVVSPSEDWLISPQFNTRVLPFLNLQWRRRFADGTVVLRGGATYARNFGDFDLDGDGDAESNVDFGDRTARSYFLGHGRFDPDGPWRWGFTAERTSDKTLFDRYDIQDPYQDNGLYYGDQRRLISQLYAERQTARSYLSVAAFTIQSLRVSRFDPVTPALNVFEDDDALPLVAPLIDARWEPETGVLGGRLRLRGSAVSIYRERYFGSPVLRPEVIPTGSTVGLPGVDSRRVTGQVDWRRTFIAPAGVRYEAFFDGRVDVYSVNDLPPVLSLDNETITRERATLGLDISYPLIRRLADGADLIVEPMGQLSLSTDPDLDPRIPNEDAETIELDESSLFRVDRFPGYDLMEGGLRLTAGVRSTIRWDQGRSASLFVGRSMRDAGQDSFRVPIPDDPSRLYDPTGLASQTSDWIVQGEFKPSDRIRSWGHATVDGSGDVRRAEAAVDGRWGRRNLATVSYILDRSNPLDGPLNRNYEFVQVAAQQFIYGNWGVTVAGIADLERDLITRSEVGLLFDDDCFRIEVGYRRDNTRVRPTGPAEGIFFRLNLATFGGSGYGSNGLR